LRNIADFRVACKWFDSLGEALSLLNVMHKDTHGVSGGKME